VRPEHCFLLLNLLEKIRESKKLITNNQNNLDANIETALARSLVNKRAESQIEHTIGDQGVLSEEKSA